MCNRDSLSMQRETERAGERKSVWVWMYGCVWECECECVCSHIQQSEPLTVKQEIRVLPCDPDSIICSMIWSGNSRSWRTPGMQGFHLQQGPWCGLPGPGVSPAENTFFFLKKEGETPFTSLIFLSIPLASGLFSVLLLLWDLWGKKNQFFS